MNFLLRTLRRFLGALKAVFTGWLPAWRELCRWRERTKQTKPSTRERWEDRAPCVPIGEPAYKRPDPMIYAQFYLMELGLAVTWDNPDIELRKNGVPVPSSQLEKSTTYQIRARIWNNSTDAPAPGLPVYFSFLSFGIGTTAQLIGSDTVDLGVKGGANHPAFATVDWHTPATEGHYCIQVWLIWQDDANSKNNYGQENTDVGQAQSPVESSFALRNDTPQAQTYRFEVDSYRIPEPPPCPREDARDAEAGEPSRPLNRQDFVVPAAHDRSNHPVPTGWTVELDPAEPTLEPQQEVTVSVKITPADGFRGTQPININAFHRRGLAGGVTLLVKS